MRLEHLSAWRTETTLFFHQDEHSFCCAFSGSDFGVDELLGEDERPELGPCSGSSGMGYRAAQPLLESCCWPLNRQNTQRTSENGQLVGSCARELKLYSSPSNLVEPLDKTPCVLHLHKLKE